jgi:hypothetical protein
MKLLVSGHRIYDDHDTTKKFICLDVKLFFISEILEKLNAKVTWTVRSGGRPV